MVRATRAAKSAKKKKNMKGRKRGGASVPCPQCGEDTRVIITRRVDGKVNRKRTCRHDHEFNTVERAIAA